MVATFASELARLNLGSAAAAPPTEFDRVWNQAVATDLPPNLARPPAALRPNADGHTDDAEDTERSGATEDVWILSQPFELLPGLIARAFIHAPAEEAQ